MSDYWEDWMRDIPFLKFPQGWQVQVLPSFGGAAARFYVINEQGGRASVFLDLHQNLTMDAPCWEVNDADMRFAVNDTDGLIAAISEVQPSEVDAPEVQP